MRLTPFQVQERLRKDLAEAVVSRARMRHEGLNAFLRERLAQGAPDEGGLLSDLLVQTAPSYVSSGKKPHDLDDLLHPLTIEAITSCRDHEMQFAYTAYEHQLSAWKILRQEPAQSLLVSSGTGSGKTECFLVPLIDDLVRASEDEGRLSGVRAIMLYPLNALIASQQARLRAWTETFSDRLRFALYNGLMPQRSNPSSKTKSRTASEVVDRKTLRDDPPPILVTNQTMLEYMTIRREDRPIIEASKGKLRWIIIDEAHSYIGSAAAELSLLLRRVMHAFAVNPEQVRIVATSATIASDDNEKARKALSNFLGDLAGVPSERAHVIIGKQQSSDFARIKDRPRYLDLARELEKGPRTLGELCTKAPDAEAALCYLAGRSADNDRPILPMRVHSFIRVVPGLWTCINPECQGGDDRPQNWPLGAVFFEEQDHCPHCRSLVFAIESCSDCGEIYLPVTDEGDRILPRKQAPELDEFREEAEREADPDDDPADAVQCDRLIAVNPIDNRPGTAIDQKSGSVASERGSFCLVDADGGRCPACLSNRRHGRSAIFPFRFGAPFLTQIGAPIILQGTSPNQEAKHKLPFEGRQLISFSDSRQGTARFAANIETAGERGYLRSFIYHAAQKAACGVMLSKEEREKLLETRRQYERALSLAPALKDEIRKIDDQLNSRGQPVPLRDLINALAEEPTLELIARVWDIDRSEEYYRDKTALARFLLMRELARRPRNANAVETLGLVRLSIARIENIKRCPEIIADHGMALEDWRDYLYFLIDYLRSNFAVDLDAEDSKWVPGRARPKNVLPPGVENGAPGDLSWPAATRAGAVQSLPVLALAQALSLDLGQGKHRQMVNDLLNKAWQDLKDLCKGPGATYRLRFVDHISIEAVEKAWICPLTGRIIPRLVFGRSPNTIRSSPRFAAQKPKEVEFPRLPHSFPEGSNQHNAIAEWLRKSEDVHRLRLMGVWTGFHDQAARLAPYLRAEEHSAQQPPHRLRQFEQQFKQGEINLLACSTTMEMGVDIGSIEAVMMTNVPPSIANYSQRAGRAGRRGQGFSQIVTLARNNPLDREAFRDPASFLGRRLAPPKVSLDSARIAQRHANALLLSAWFAEAGGEFARTKAGNFFGRGSDLGKPIEPAPVDRFCQWLQMPETIAGMRPALTRLLRGTALEHQEDIHKNAAEMFSDSAQEFHIRWQRLKDDHDRIQANEAARKSVEYQASRLCREYLLKELANRALIPGNGFPTDVVPFDTLCAHTMDSAKRAKGQAGDEEGARSRRYDCPSRNADIAIREYAPGAEVVIDGLVWQSAGLTLNWLSPIDSGVREPQSLRWAWWCKECGAAGTSHSKPEACEVCEESTQSERFIQPAGFRVDWAAKPHADADYAQYIEPLDPIVSTGLKQEGWNLLQDETIGRIGASHKGMIYHHSRGAEGNGYYICLECGRAAEGADALKDHRPLTPRTGGAGSLCPGNQASYAIHGPLSLGYEVQTDVAEIQLFAVESEDEAWALASAIRESLAKRLGIEPREMGLSIARRRSKIGGLFFTIFIFDQASGGAGYAPRLRDEPWLILQMAQERLDCPKNCDRGCSACVLAPDLQAAKNGLARKRALETLRNALEGRMALEPEDKIDGEQTRRVVNLAAHLALEVRRGDRLRIFLPGEFDLAALQSPKMAALFSQARNRGARVELVLSAESFVALDEVERVSLRDIAIRHELGLSTVLASCGIGAHHCLAEIACSNGATGYFTRDSSATMPGDQWGASATFPIVAKSLEAPSKISPILKEDLELGTQIRDKVELIKGFAQCPVDKFGDRLVSRLQRALEKAGGWKLGQLTKIVYSDRYLKSPLTALLFLRTCEALARSLGHAERLRVEIKTKSIGWSARSSYRIFDDWDDEEARRATIDALGSEFNLDIVLETSDNLPHGRIVELHYSDNSKTMILLDQGFGYWRIAGTMVRHPFDSDPRRQAAQLARANFAVSGSGKSYFAIAVRN